MDKGTFAAIVLIISIAFVFVALIIYASRLPRYDYYTIEGRIVQIWGGERTTIVWENNCGTHGLTFISTSLPLPIGENIRITYYYTGSHSSYPIIENIEVLG